MTPLLVDRVARWARERPGAPAVIESGGLVVSYAQLWRRATALAASIEPGQRVALEHPRGAAWIAGALGIWAAGSAFVPIAPSAPPRRRAQMLADAGVGGPAAGEPDRRLAYVIFTSGSTGRPKGVEIEHRGVANVIAQQAEAFAVTGDSRVAWLLSPTFDASLSDVGVALFAGAAIVAAPEPAPVGPALLDWLGERAVTHADLPPALLPHLDPARAPRCLETVVIGGEVADVVAVRRWAAAVRLIGAYGPTEATICTGLVRCRPDWDRPLIGRPLDGVDYVVGDRGELLIGGCQLARGYAAQPQLTAERFVYIDGARYFCTGDRVRELGDGDWEYLGRLDRQLKIAGRLIAPEEIEAALRACGGGEVAVTWRPPRTLVAHVTGEVDRAALARRLPAWMIPHIERLAALPRTTSNKIDTVALAARPLGSDRPPEVLTQREAIIAGLVARITGVAATSPADTLADLGGDSLSAVALIAAAESFGLAITPDAIDGPWTIAALAAASEQPTWRTCAELAADATAPPNPTIDVIDADDRRPPAQTPRSLLVTGATGRLGHRVVAALIERLPGVQLAGLARNPSRLPPGVSPVRGNLAAPDLGLDAATWHRLAAELDGVVHLGARLDVLANYAELRAVNLEGTRAVVRLVAGGRPKRLIAASTLSVFAASDRRGRCLESDTLDGDRRLAGGYAQSKAAAEFAIRAAALPGTAIVRLGLLADGGGERDWLTMFVSGARLLGALPVLDEPVAVDVTPIDHAASVIAALAAAPPPPGVATYHVAARRGATLDELAAAIGRVFGPLERLAPAAWIERVRRAAPSADVAALMLGLCRAAGSVDHRFDVFAATGLDIDDRETRAATGMARPEISDALLDRVLSAIDPEDDGDAP